MSIYSTSQDHSNIHTLNREARKSIWLHNRISKVAWKGRFRPNNPHKYRGDPTNIIYRSRLELRVMQYLDSTESIREWESEERPIPYYDPVTQRWRRYFPDFVVYTDKDTIMVEVKPFKQTQPPTGQMHQDGRKNRRLIKEQVTYATNCAKWEAAKEFCADRKWQFKFITEKDLGGW